MATQIQTVVTVGLLVLVLLVAVFVYRNTVVFAVAGDANIDDGTLFVNSTDNRVGIKNKIPTFTLDITGDVNTSTKIREGGYVLIPHGTIVMWTGSLAPSGWALCDGANGTPDLRGRFVLSFGQGSGLTNRLVNQTGGAETHTLTVNEMPSHTHTGTTAASGDHNHSGSTSSNGAHTHTINDPGHSHTMTINNTDDENFSAQPGQVPPADANTAISSYQSGTSTTGITINSNGSHAHSINTDGSHSHTFTTNSTGGDQAHNNMPPFYVLAYIMKL